MAKVTNNNKSVISKQTSYVSLVVLKILAISVKMTSGISLIPKLFNLD